MDVTFKDNSIAVKKAIEYAAIKYLQEASSELVSRIARNSPVDSGQLKNSWKYEIDEGEKKSTIGSPLEYSIWSEFGTGEYALKGNGRKGGWTYKDDDGYHFTYGSEPHRTLETSFNQTKPLLISLAKQVFKDGVK